jgi:sugar transferase (PEP-CTERM system associated)
MQVFERHVSPHELIVFGCEIILISGWFAWALLLSQPESSAHVWKVLLAALLCQLFLYYNDFYDLRRVHSGQALVGRLVQSTGAASIALGLLYLAIPAAALDADSFLRSLAALIVIVLTWRLLVNRAVEASPLIEHTLIVGSGPSARAVAHELRQREFESQVIGYVSDGPDGDADDDPAPRLGRIGDLRAIVRRRGDIHRIVVSPDAGSSLPVGALAEAKLSGVFVEDAVTAYERLTGRILIEEWKLRRLVFEEGFRVSRRRQAAKRAADVTLAGAGLILVAPLLVLTAALVWLGSGRPVLYRQTRVGQHGAPFTLYKFRSMRVDAEAAGPTWATASDSRVTLVGRLIRRSRLDELPQLWNVLKGDMSFVGPRPERPCFVQELVGQIPFYRVRHVVKPGITGWAQVRYRYADSVESAMEKLRFDLYYVKHFSFAFDLTIVIDTVKIVLFRQGAR